MIIRLGFPLLVTAAQLGAAMLALGRPDVGLALAFIGTGWPTAGETLSALDVLVWAIVLSGMAWSLGGMARRASGSRLLREGSMLATGLLILVAGAGHHASTRVDMSGGTAQEALRFLGH